ncbi:MAG: sulfotransferase domain-containing protein [Egibacteraceae bacterium]
MVHGPIPRRVRTYRNHHLDSTRWDRFRPRLGDVVISTSPKAGTTWLQRILSLLIFGPGRLPDTLWRLSPWIDSRVAGPIDIMIERTERQDHQRFVKSHLPLDALPYQPQLRYIYVGRDTRDVFVSLWNHYRSHTDFTYEALAAGDPEGGPIPRCPNDPRDLWRAWITRGSFPWETDGWPFWSHHYHAASFWQFRHLPNLLLVHYNDLLADPAGQMRRIAEFVRIDVPAERWPALVDAAGFDTMKRQADRLIPETFLMLEGGPTRFFHKGTNGRWRQVLNTDDLVFYERAAAALDPDLRRWLEAGSLVAGDPQVEASHVPASAQPHAVKP